MPNQPKNDDVVLGGNFYKGGAVLGGIEGLKRRLNHQAWQVRTTALSEAIAYRDTGLDLVINALQDNSVRVRQTALALLQQSSEPKVKRAVQSYRNSLNIIKEGIGYKKAKLGMNQQQVLTNLGKPEKIRRYDKGKSLYYCYYSLGLSVLFIQDLVTTLFFYSGIAGGNIRGNYQRFSGQTESCINFNSDNKEVIQIYGDLKEQEEELLASIPGIRVFYP
ncbi:MAG: HEAT repeat domain-containing protein, partial [Spirulinaceae cyanobacterium]